jgi:hypothetical protein
VNKDFNLLANEQQDGKQALEHNQMLLREYQK